MMKQICIGLTAFATLYATAQTARAGACANPGWSADVLTSQKLRLPVGGAVLVAGVQSYGLSSGLRTSQQKPSFLPALRLARGGQTLRFRVEKLAPGLSRYVPVRRVRGNWTIRAGKFRRTVSFSGRGMAKLASPTITLAKTFSRKWRNFRGYSSTSHYASAEVSGRVPADVVAVIAYGKSGNTWRPLLYQRVAGSALRRRTKNTISLYSSPGRCSSLPWGFSSPYGGQILRLRWVDRYGRLSPPSNAVMVKALGLI